VGGVLIRFALDTYPSIQTDGEPLPNGDDGFFEGVSGSYGSFAHTGLSGCEMYYYTAWSYDEFLRFSDPVHVSYISMIDTVNYFVANAGDRSVHLIWTAPLDERCEYHNAVVIRYSTEGPVYTVEDGQPVENGNEGRFVIHRKHDLYSFEHSELIPGATYYYSAFVVSDNPDRASIPVSRSAVPIKVVESVQGFEAEGEDRSVDLTWIAPVDTELEGLKIRYSRFAPPAELSEGTAVENGNDGIFEAEPGENGSYTHRGLINDTTYYYSIWAFDEAGYHSEPSHAQAVPLDNIPPDISVAVFQNPYLSEHIDIYVRASEELMSDSLCVSVGSDTVSMEIVPGGYSLYRGDHTLTAPAASITLAACACDLAGNRGCTTLDFAAGYLVAELGGTVSSPDGRMRLSIPPNTTTHDAFILVTPCFESGYVPYTEAASIWTAGTPDTDCGGMMSTTFSIGPVGLLRGNPAHLSIEYSDGEIEEGVHPDQLYIEQDDVGALPCYVDPGSRIVETDIHALGTFRLRAGERGASRILDPSYLRVGSPSPNPFEREITVRFELRAPQHVGVVVYDIAGREIARLSDGKMSPGMRHITWDGRGRMGEVPSGVYFLRIATDHKAATRKLLLLR
jgi:hypothetical protein